MNTRIFDAFEAREEQVKSYMAGCAMRYGMECSCGPDCRCQNCPVHSDGGRNRGGVPSRVGRHAPLSPSGLQQDIFETILEVDQPMEFYGMDPSSGGSVGSGIAPLPDFTPAPTGTGATYNQHSSNEHYRPQRNPSVISYGNGLRHMSLTSETTFGRAMSGLSALSIDWENLEDFDVDVDHSSHINNATISPGKMYNFEGGNRRRSSMRRSFLVSGAAAAIAASAMGNEPQEGSRVSFKE
jgi:hypothetical protein